MKQVKRTPLNHDFFKSWSDKMAYVLGFWYADGNITKPESGKYAATFRSKDYEHLVLLREVFQSEHKIYDYGDKPWKLEFGSKTMWTDIQLLGGLPAKSLIATFPKVPNQYLIPFIRGYVDGDGSLFWRSRGNTPVLSICGTIPFLIVLSKLIEKFTGIPSPTVIKHKNKVPSTTYNGLKAKLLAIWLYDNDNLALARKNKLSKEFTSWSPKRYCNHQKTITLKMRKLFSVYIPNN